MKFISTQFLLFQMVAGVLALSFVSCGSDDDEDPEDTSEPVIEITKPSNNDLIVPGTSDLIVEGTLNDNVALSVCTISIEYNEESETSAGVMNEDQMKSTSGDDGDGTVTGIDDEPWDPNPAEISLSGEETYEFETGYKPFGSVPADIKFGEYTLTIEVEDEAGNVATEEIVLDFSGE
ncbi:MAG: DUF4625 domain-containing protein [Marinilabiliaceae bacterium]